MVGGQISEKGDPRHTGACARWQMGCRRCKYRRIGACVGGGHGEPGAHLGVRFEIHHLGQGLAAAVVAAHRCSCCPRPMRSHRRGRAGHHPARPEHPGPAGRPEPRPPRQRPQRPPDLRVCHLEKKYETEFQNVTDTRCQMLSLIGLGSLALAAPSPRVNCHAAGIACCSVFLKPDGTVASVAPATLDPAAAAWGEWVV